MKTKMELQCIIFVPIMCKEVIIIYNISVPKFPYLFPLLMSKCYNLETTFTGIFNTLQNSHKYHPFA